MKHTKHMIPLFLLILLWSSITLFCWLKPADSFSTSERRKLAQKPTLTFTSFRSGNYFREFENYSLDQFPLRDQFRTLKSVSEYFLFAKNDNNNIYISDGYAAKMEYPLNEASVQNAIDKINELYETYLTETSGNIYLSVIPDKGYFLHKQTGHLALDYDAMFQMLPEGIPFAEYIDLTPTLELSDYYKTDSHWKQESLTDTACYLADAMGVHLSGNYEKTTVDKPFYGVYYGQSALPLEPDTIHYLTNSTLDGCSVYNAETGDITGLYNLAKLESRDMYEVYLSGASPILTITNPNAVSEKELIIFRDSFASSLAPLLAEGYSKITLLDTRYIQPELLGEYVDFTSANQDILFLYSTSLLNSSQVLR